MAKTGIKSRYNPETGKLEIPLNRGVVGHLLTLRLFVQALLAHKLGDALRADCEKVEPLLAAVERVWRGKIKVGKKPRNRTPPCVSCGRRLCFDCFPSTGVLSDGTKVLSTWFSPSCAIRGTRKRGSCLSESAVC